MGARQQPIPIASATREDGATRVAEQFGRTLGQWVRELGSWRQYLDRTGNGARQFWSDVQEPRRRERHIWTLVAIAASAGFLVGALLVKTDD